MQDKKVSEKGKTDKMRRLLDVRKICKIENIILIVPVLVVIGCIFGGGISQSIILRATGFAFISVFVNLVLWRIIYEVLCILKCRFSRTELIVMFILYVLICVYVVVNVLHRDFIYYWDYSLYIAKQYGLERIFKDYGILAGIKEIVRSYNYEYTHCINVFLEFPFCLTTRTPKAYIFSQLFNSVLPFVVLMGALSKEIINKILEVQHSVFCFVFSMIILLSYPLLYICLIGCIPDQFGLIFCIIMILLTLRENFRELDYKKFFCLYLVSALLIVTRRWYLFFILGYYTVWGLASLIDIAIQGRENRELAMKRLKNMFLITMIYLVISVILFSKMARNIFLNHYSEKYVAYKGNGFIGELDNQYGVLGFIMICLIIIGICFLISQRRTRVGIIMIAGYFLSLFLFTRIQQMGDHQSLLLVPYYSVLIIAGVSCICSFRRRFVKEIGIVILSLAVSISVYINFFQNQITSKIFSKVNLVMEARDDIEEIKEMAEWLNENCGYEVSEKAYIIPHCGTWESGSYCPDLFRNAFLPDTSLRDKIYYGSAAFGTHLFPTGLFTAKYVLTCDPFPKHSKTSALAEKYNNLFLDYKKENEKFELVKEFDMGNGTIFYCWKRVKEADLQEVEYYRKAMEEESEKFPELYEKLLLNFEVENGLVK